MIPLTFYDGVCLTPIKTGLMLCLVLFASYPSYSNPSCYPSRIVDFQEGMRGGNSRKTLSRSEECKKCKGDTAWEEEQDIMSGLSYLHIIKGRGLNFMS